MEKADSLYLYINTWVIIKSMSKAKKTRKTYKEP